MTPDQQRRSDELIGAHLDGALGPDEVREFAALLTAHPDVRTAFAQALVLDTALPTVVRRRLSAWWWTSGLAAAAAVLLGVGYGYLHEKTGPEVLGSGAIVVRDGRELHGENAGHLRAADVVRATGSPVSLRWASEGTTMELAAGGTCTVVAPGPTKDLLLSAGELSVAAAHQTSGATLTVRTDRLSVAVVGTHFSVRNDGSASQVSVSEGRVALTAGAQQRPLAAGQTAVCGHSGDMLIGPTAPVVMTTPLIRVDAAAWRAVLGKGWAGTLRGEDLIAEVASATAERVTVPERDAGYGVLRADLRVTIDVTLAQPGTVAVFLVCRKPDGRDWIGNYRLEEKLSAGRHQRTWTVADCVTEKGVSLSEALGGQISCMTVGAWTQPVGLVVHTAAIGP